jgi:hypothetical protein
LSFNENRFGRLVLVAGPKLLGTLQKALPAQLACRVNGAFPKDMMRESLEALQELVADELKLPASVKKPSGFASRNGAGSGMQRGE